MAQKKITDLQLVDEVTDDLNFGTDDTLQSYRATGAQIKEYVKPFYFPPIRLTYKDPGTIDFDKVYAFKCANASATVGAEYTHNSNTYTVLKTVSSEDLIYLSSPDGAPLVSGTLTKSSGTGDATISFTLSRVPLFYDIRLRGAGGGGAGSVVFGGSGQGNGSAGGDTTFGTTLLVAEGGFYGSPISSPGVGGDASLDSSIEGIAIKGAPGTTGDGTTVNGVGGVGGRGGGEGAGYGGWTGTAGGNAEDGSGGGGGGAGSDYSASGGYGGSGGGQGGWAHGILKDPGDTYELEIGAKGTGGTAGTNGYVGGDGGDGHGDITVVFQ